MWGHYGSRIVGIFSGPLSEALGLTINILWWFRPSFYGGLCPIYFFRELGYGGSILCFMFRIFDRPILKEYVFQVKKGPHLFQTCLHVTQNGLPLVARDIHPSFDSLAVISAPSLQAFWMYIHHDTPLRFILEDDSISSTTKAHIHFCLSKGVGLWLVASPSIHWFRIAHSTFTSLLHFRFSLIQPLASNFLTCECGHSLNASGTHLTHCLFRGQQITTHDAIWNVMYTFVWKSGHVVWKELWYTLTSKVSLWTDLYMTQEDLVFIVGVVVID